MDVDMANMTLTCKEWAIAIGVLMHHWPYLSSSRSVGKTFERGFGHYLLPRPSWVRENHEPHSCIALLHVRKPLSVFSSDYSCVKRSRVQCMRVTFIDTCVYIYVHS